MTHEKKVGVKTIKWGHCLNVIGWGASAKGMDEGNAIFKIKDTYKKQLLGFTFWSKMS